MEKLPLISQMQKFQFGCKIVCSDGENGVLSHVGFDPTTRRMTYIGIKPGHFRSKTVYTPYETVIDATGDGILLNITYEELDTSTAKPEGLLFDAKSVVATSSAQGSLRLIAVHPKSGELSYCVVHHLHPGHNTLILQPYIAKLEPQRIVITIPDAELQALPPYRTDAELRQEVENILLDLTPLHVDFKGMRIRVLDSVLYLDGNISSSLRGDIVQDQAYGIPGLLEIKNHLVGDDQLAGNLAMALAHDPRTRDLPIGVYPRLGSVRLSGAVHNEQQKAAAIEIAGSFPGVRSVSSDLVIDAQADMLHVMSSAEGGEADDIIPGKYIRHTR